MSVETIIFFALFVSSPKNNQSKFKQSAKEVAGQAAKGAATGAAKGAAKGAVVGGAKGTVKGAQRGAQWGAKAGSVLPGAGTAVGGVVGGVVGGAAGGTFGAAKGAAVEGGKGALRGARQGAQKGFYQKGLAALRNKLQKGGLVAAGPVGTGIQTVQFVKKHRDKILALIIILFLIFFVIFDALILDPPPPSDVPTTNDTCIPAQFTGDAFGKTAVCTITVTYNGSADNIIITSTILPGTEFVSAGQGGSYDKVSNTVTWDAQKLNLPLNPINIVVTVTIRITTHQINTIVYNAYAIQPVNLQSGTTGNVTPNHSTCNGKYNLTSPYENFGDPQCNFTLQGFGQEVRTMDPSNYLIWDCMAMHESGYNPNAYNPNSASGNGAYGLLQMNPQGRGNGQYDAGNVNWPLQISNAINYNQKVISGSFAYWATYAGCH